MTTPSVRVLVVDDSATIRRVVGSVLRRAGHEVVTGETGELALVEVGVFNPDIVLLDYTMPDMANADFLRRLAVEHPHELPIILMATRGDRVPAVDANLRAVGVVDVITKPFSPEALLAVIQNSLDKRGKRPSHNPAFRDTTRLVPSLASLAAASDEGEVTEVARRRESASVNRASDGRFPGGPDAFAGDDVTERTKPRGVIDSTRNAPPTEIGSISSAPLSLAPGVSLCGDLTVIALPEVLQLLKFQSQTGLLLVDASGLRFELGLEAGAVVALSAREPDGSPTTRGELLLGRYFVTSGVDEATLSAHLAQPGSAPIGERLVAAGVITTDELHRALGEQTQDLMVELLRARRGIFALSTTQQPSVVVRPGWSVDVLMFEALRRIDEWSVIESEVPSFDARFALRLSSSGALDDSGLSAEEGAILRQLKSGPLGVRDLVKRSPLRPFDVCRVVYRLSVLKRVRRIDDGDRSRLVSEESERVPLLSTPPREVL